MKLDKQTLQTILILVFGLLGFNTIINNLHIIPQAVSFLINLLFPFILGGAIAFVINVPMKKIEQQLEFNTKLSKNQRRILSLFLAILIVLGIVAFVLFLVIPSFIKASMDLINALPSMIANITDQLKIWFEGSPQVLEQIDNVQSSLSDLLGTVVKTLSNSAGDIVARLLSVLNTTISTLFNILVGFIFAIYILLAKEGLKRQYQKILFALFKAENANYILDFGTLTNHIFSNFLTGQLTEAFINGSMYFIASLIFKFPYGMVISVLMGFCALIPYFGAFIGAFIGTVLIASQSLSAAVLFFVLCIIIQQFDGNVIYPRVVGDQIGLPAIWVLVAVTIGASLWGFVGMIVMVPLASVIYSLSTMWINRRLEKREIKIDELEPRKLGRLFPRKDGSHDEHTL